MMGDYKRKHTKSFLATTCLFFVGLLTGFAQLTDNFTDGDFTNSPSWNGDGGLFTIASGELNSQSPGAATYYLSTPSALASDAQWEFFIDLQFATSGANFVDVYLMSDATDLNTTSNGYFIRLGGTSDEISLYSMVGGASTIIIDGVDGLINSSSSNPFNIRVTRDVSNLWNLAYDDGATGSFISAGTVTDASINSSSFFGVLIEQSSAASAVNGHFFDNFIVGNIPVDLTPPNINSVAVVSITQLDVLFSEPVNQTTAEASSNYFASSGLGNPTTAVQDGSNPALIHLTFPTPFTNGQVDTLTIQNIEDLSVNTMITETQTFMYFVSAIPSYRDVVINEIFADPTPQLGLPAADFIELYNASDSIFDLNGWVFSDAAASEALGTYILLPGEYVVIADDNYTFDFSVYPNVLFVASFPALNISGDDLTLQDNLSNTIDQVSYSDSWYQDAIKDDGGYSLEQINPTIPCVNSSNWTGANITAYGTPGTINSVYDGTPDVTSPSIITSDVLSATTVDLCFDETIDTSNIVLSQFSCSGGITVTNLIIYPSANCISLTLSPVIDTGVVYTLTLNGMGDCSGNLVSNSTSQIILPHTGAIGDLIINEVLFNPFTGGDDFVEIYNNSEKYLDLYNWKLANWDDGIIDNFKAITIHKLMRPGDYIVLTKDSSDIQSNYLNAIFGNFVQLASLPTYSNDSGTVYLILPDLDSTVCDYFSYDEDLQFGLINNPDGISLERIDFNRPTNESTNWHSAAESVGWATPGLENSQYYPGQITSDAVSVEPEIFSPDNDGFDDILNINYTMSNPGFVGSVTIFDANGRIIRSLVQNELLAATGTISWDGLNNKREKARIGMYIVYFEVFDLEGNVSGVKKTCVVASKFN
ncbi:lamin tail domain-containing protein [Flavobacteriales bacterium]|nr:lamin tail domain-containing protein [Flavobacteriales bacterium]